MSGPERLLALIALVSAIYVFSFVSSTTAQEASTGLHFNIDQNIPAGDVD